MEEKQYRELKIQYEKEFAYLMREWHGKFFQHLYLNTELDKMFKIFEEKRAILPSELVKYLETRSENDRINSEFKIISTKTNDLWIKIQELDKKITIQNEVNIIFIDIDKTNGRLNYYLDFTTNPRGD